MTALRKQGKEGFTSIEVMIVSLILILLSFLFFQQLKELPLKQSCKRDCTSWSKVDYVCIEKCIEMKEGVNNEK